MVRWQSVCVLMLTSTMYISTLHAAQAQLWAHAETAASPNVYRVHKDDKARGTSVFWLARYMSLGCV
jgi:hypothetical protein